MEIIEQKVRETKEIAIGIGNELELQDKTIDNITEEVQKTNVKLQHLNSRLKNKLDKIRKCDRFVIDFICCILLLAIFAYIYNLFSKK